MSGWVPMPADGWLDTAELLTSTGRPWPDHAAITDLRWYVDQGRTLPGRPTLGRRWNWPDRRVRALLADPERWWDRLRGPAPTSRAELCPAGVQPVSSERPAGVQPEAQSSASDRAACPAGVQPVSSERPAGVHTRGDPPSPSPPPSRVKDTPPSPSPVLQLVSPLDAPTELDPVPKWARVRGQPPHLVLACVTRAIEAIRQRPVLADRCATDAAHVLGLQRVTDTPWPELADQVELVARWAREAPSAANDLRGVRPDGTTWGRDRSRSVKTLCVHASWADRLDDARRWADGLDPPADARPAWQRVGAAAPYDPLDDPTIPF